MLQKTEDARQERFLEVVDSLNLRFPGKVITEKTGYNSGIVSEYLNSKKKVSERFLREFSKAFNLDYNTIFKIGPIKADDTMNPERALLLAVAQDYAEWKAKMTGQPFQEVKTELKKKASLILNDLHSWLPGDLS